jgi:hypothetical protein
MIIKKHSTARWIKANRSASKERRVSFSKFNVTGDKGTEPRGDETTQKRTGTEKTEHGKAELARHHPFLIVHDF